MNRRRFLQTIAATSTAPLWLRYATAAGAAPTSPGGGMLFVVFLRGGNDPLNTIAPYQDAAYQRARPKTKLTARELTPMGNGMGIHNSLPTFSQWWRAGGLAVVQQVGIGKPDFSHTSATTKCETGDADARYTTGWLGRYLDATTPRGAVRAAAIGDTLPGALVGQGVPGLAIDTLDDFMLADSAYPDVQPRRGALSSFSHDRPSDGSMRAAAIEGQLQMLDAIEPIASARRKFDGEGHAPTAGETIARLFAAGVGTEIGYVTLTGFDTHSDQRGRHLKLLSDLESLTSTYFTAADRLGVADQCSMLVLSEFGRRVYENRSEGTDHGAATNAYLLGPRVRGGLYGPKLDLSALQDGNLPVRLDLRSVYASVLDQWMNTDHAAILGKRFQTLPLFK